MDLFHFFIHYYNYFFFSPQEACVDIVHGFVEHLEVDEDSLARTEAETQRQLKEDIIRLLISCVLKRSRNIAHLLLGFEQAKENLGGHSKKLSDIILQDPGTPDTTGLRIACTCTLQDGLLVRNEYWES